MKGIVIAGGLLGCWALGLLVMHLWQFQTPLPTSVPKLDRAVSDINSHELALGLGWFTPRNGVAAKVGVGDHAIEHAYDALKVDKANRSILDPWERPYRALVSESDTGSLGITIYSLGADGAKRLPGAPHDDVGFMEEAVHLHYYEQRLAPALQKRRMSWLLFGTAIGLVMALLISPFLFRKNTRNWGARR